MRSHQWYSPIIPPTIALRKQFSKIVNKQKDILAMVADVALVEAMLFLTRKELCELERATKYFHRFTCCLATMPQLHVINTLWRDNQGFYCIIWHGPRKGMPDLRLRDIAAQGTLVRSSYYVRFMYISSVRLGYLTDNQRDMLWLRSLRHTYPSCALNLGIDPHVDGSTKKNSTPTSTLKQAVGEVLELFTECHSILIETMDLEWAGLLEPATLVSWLHSGGKASTMRYDNMEVVEGGGYKRFVPWKLVHQGCKYSRLNFLITQPIYNELRKALSEAFVCDREEHPYRLQLMSESPLHLAAEKEGYVDVLVNPFTEEQLGFTVKYCDQIPNERKYTHTITREKKVKSH